MNSVDSGAATTHEELKKSADTLATNAAEQVDSADRRTELAADRTILAAERTYAAWVRTGLAALASGVGARALLDEVVVGWLSRTAGAVLAFFAGFCFVAAIWRDITPSVRPPRPRVRRLPPMLLFVVNGFLVVVAIAAVIGILSAA